MRNYYYYIFCVLFLNLIYCAVKASIARLCIQVFSLSFLLQSERHNYNNNDCTSFSCKSTKYYALRKKKIKFLPFFCIVFQKDIYERKLPFKNIKSLLLLQIAILFMAFFSLRHYTVS